MKRKSSSDDKECEKAKRIEHRLSSFCPVQNERKKHSKNNKKDCFYSIWIAFSCCLIFDMHKTFRFESKCKAENVVRVKTPCSIYIPTDSVCDSHYIRAACCALPATFVWQLHFGASDVSFLGKSEFFPFLAKWFHFNWFPFHLEQFSSDALAVFNSLIACIWPKNWLHTEISPTTLCPVDLKRDWEEKFVRRPLKVHLFTKWESKWFGLRLATIIVNAL